MRLETYVHPIIDAAVVGRQISTGYFFAIDFDGSGDASVRYAYEALRSRTGTRPTRLLINADEFARLLFDNLCRCKQRERSSLMLFLKKMQRFLVSDDGPTAVEYAVMLALIVIVCLAAIGTIGTNANTTFTNVANSIGTVS